MEKTLLEQRDGLRQRGIRFTAIGELQRLPARLGSLLREIQEDCLRNDDPAGAVITSAVESISSAGNGAGDSLPREASDGVSMVGGVSRGGAAAGTRVATLSPSAGGFPPQLNGDQKAAGVSPNTRHENEGCDRNSVESASRTREPRVKPQTMTLCLAISYGGRAELAAAARELAEEAAAGKIDARDIDEEALGRRLSTTRLGIPDPDLVVRTSGESRLSNLLVWQAAYSELCVVSKPWPEFRRSDLLEAFRYVGCVRKYTTF